MELAKQIEDIEALQKDLGVKIQKVMQERDHAGNNVKDWLGETASAYESLDEEAADPGPGQPASAPAG